MAATTVNIVSLDTLPTLQAGQTYGADYFNQLVIDTGTDDLYRITSGGLLQGPFQLGASTTYEAPAAITGTVIPVPGMLATSIVEFAMLDTAPLYPSQFTQQTGQITLVGITADASFFFCRFK